MKLLAKRRVRELLAISRATLDRLIARGDLPVVRVGPRAVRVDEAALHEFVRQRTRRGSMCPHV